jgi:hypothetical protein
MSIGSDMRELKSSVTRSLCDQIFTSLIHWPKATNFPETVTHAIDFGPSGLSGIGSLTARNQMVVVSVSLLQVKRVKVTPSFKFSICPSVSRVGTRSGLLA